MTNEGWIFRGQGQPLERVPLPTPQPGPHEVLIDVAAAGLCHSDVGIISGPGAAWISQLPIVLGHEVAGTISELGSEVTGFAIGDRVAVALIGHPAEEWRGMVSPGISRDGGFQRQAIAEDVELIPIPDGVSFSAAATATDSIATAYHAVTAAGAVEQGTVVGIVGMGGLGMNAVQIALWLGAEVHGVDVSADARDQASTLGAASVHEQVVDLAAFSPDVIIDFAGYASTTGPAVEVVRRGGTVVVVGLGQDTVPLPKNTLVFNLVRVVGSAGASRDDLRTVLQLLAEGTITSTVRTIPFAELANGMERLTAGNVVGRLALDVTA